MKKLVTVKDGRQFAISLLVDLVNTNLASSDDVFSCLAKADDEAGSYDMPEQTTVIRDAFDRIYSEATEDARRGFWIVITDAFGAAYTIGKMEPETYQQYEDDGRMKA